MGEALGKMGLRDTKENENKVRGRVEVQVVALRGHKLTHWPVSSNATTRRPKQLTGHGTLKEKDYRQIQKLCIESIQNQKQIANIGGLREERAKVIKMGREQAALFVQTMCGSKEKDQGWECRVADFEMHQSLTLE